MNNNRISVTGRIGQDIEMKYFESGNCVAKFTMAVRREGGKKDDPPSWYSIILWGKTAEIANEYAGKGHVVGITGELTVETWNDRDSGELRIKPVIRGDVLELIAKADSKASTSSPSSKTNSSTYDDEF